MQNLLLIIDNIVRTLAIQFNNTNGYKIQQERRS